MGIVLTQQSADDFLRICISTKERMRKRKNEVFINMQLRSSWLSHNIQVPWYHKKQVYKIQIRRAKTEENITNSLNRNFTPCARDHAIYVEIIHAHHKHINTLKRKGYQQIKRRSDQPAPRPNDSCISARSGSTTRRCADSRTHSGAESQCQISDRSCTALDTTYSAPQAWRGAAGSM